MRQHKDVQVLIAEDDYLVSQLIKSSLEEIGGYQVIGEAIDGQQAVEMAGSLQPDIVLMDIKMPGLDGLEATRQIARNCPAPVVVLTAYDTPDLIAQAGEAGAGAFVIKPPTAQEMERAMIIAMARFDDMIKLRRLNEELRARNEELDTFAHTVAHQLKNSASLVSTFGNILKAQLKLTEAQQPYLDSIIESGHKMNNVISELQLLAGVRAGEIKQEPLDMSQIVAEVRQRLQYIIQEEQAQIVEPDEWPPALGYAPWVEEIWMNYIGNAIKYGGQPPRIELGAELQPDDLVQFWVQDNGAGLSAEAQAHIFKPFTRPSQIRIEGHGLGLSIVRHIVEKLGGQVGVESEGLAGHGSRFTFTLPHAAGGGEVD